jgi:transcriptional regulator with XRE-family HTH domain
MSRTKAISEAMNRRVGAVIAEVVREQFAGNQSRAAEALGLSQSHLSNLMSGRSGRGVGLPVLLILREKTNRSIDDILGLTGTPEEMSISQLRESIAESAKAREAMLKAAELLVQAAEKPSQPALPRQKRRKWTEAQEVKYRHAAQKIADAEAAKKTPEVAPAQPRKHA